MRIAIALNSPTVKRNITDSIICADGGFNYVDKSRVVAIVGDCDSIEELPKDITLVKYPKEKNMTDGEIAVRYAVTCGYNELDIYGGDGGRTDHVLANLSLLNLASELGARARLVCDGYEVLFVTDSVTIATHPNEIISIFAYGNDAKIECGEGLYYSVKQLELKSFCTRGVSNLATKDNVYIKMAYGRLLVFHYTNN